MKNKVLSILVALFIVFTVSIPSFAIDYYTDEGAWEYADIPGTRQLPLLVDDADIISYEDEEELLSKLDEISTRQSMDVAVVTVESLEGKTATEYADDFYDYNGYGQGENKDGILILFSMDEREWHITTTGEGIDVFTDSCLDYLMYDCGVLDLLSDGDYADAFVLYAETCDEFITNYNNGISYMPSFDEDYEDNYYDYYDYYDNNSVDYYGDNHYSSSTSWTVEDYITKLIGCIVIGFIIAFIIVKIQANALKSVKHQDNAVNYIAPETVALTSKRDQFLYKNVTAARIERDNDSHSSHHGSSSGMSHGSTTHVSSSGVSHGGSGGKF